MVTTEVVFDSQAARPQIETRRAAEVLHTAIQDQRVVGRERKRAAAGVVEPGRCKTDGVEGEGPRAERRSIGDVERGVRTGGGAHQSDAAGAAVVAREDQGPGSERGQAEVLLPLRVSVLPPLTVRLPVPERTAAMVAWVVAVAVQLPERPNV